MRQFDLWPAMLVVACQLTSGDSVPDDIRVLNAIFPSALISLDLRPDPESSSSTDPGKAFGDSPAYRVIAAPRGRNELCAASDAVNQRHLSDERQVRIRIFKIPQSADFVSVTQYKFFSANPPMSCPSLARVDYLLQTAGRLYDT